MEGQEKTVRGIKTFLKTLVTVVLFIIYMFPFYMIVLNAFKHKRDIIKMPLSWGGKKGFTTENFVEAFQQMNFMNILKLFLAGALAAGTMVIPGVSGSMVMMIIGYYTVIIGTISGLIDALHPFDMAGILAACGVLVPFGIGVLVGIVVIAKLIEFVLKKYSQTAYWSIIGLIVASPFAILIMMGSVTINVVNILTGIIMLAIGFLIAMKLGGE